MKRESEVSALFRRHRYIIERVKHGKHWKVWAFRNGRTRQFVVSVLPSDYRALKNLNADRAGDHVQHLLGASNVELSSRCEQRWGDHGSFSVIVDGPKAGVWHDHETNEAGDMHACPDHARVRLKPSERLPDDRTTTDDQPNIHAMKESNDDHQAIRSSVNRT